jgi:tripartite-type tricarboxylate transporter receptor subunit TctC
MRVCRLLLMIVISIAPLCRPAQAASYPDRPVRVVVPFPAGGPTDVAARIFAQYFSTKFGKQFFIENRTGAAGTIGTAVVAAAPADGYTLLITSAAHATGASYYPNLSYDPSKSFAGVAELVDEPLVIAVKSSSKYQTFQDLIKASKNAGAGLNYAAGAGGPSVSGLIARLLLDVAGMKGQEIPYRGSAPALQDLLTGNVVFDVDLPGGMMGLIGSKDVRPLAVTTKTRYKFLPDVPTVAETLGNDFNETTWAGLFAPAGTPPAIVEQLSAAVNEALKSPEVIKQLDQQGLTPVGGSVAHIDTFVRQEATKWGGVIKKFNLTAE